MSAEDMEAKMKEEMVKRSEGMSEKEKAMMEV